MKFSPRIQLSFTMEHLTQERMPPYNGKIEVEKSDFPQDLLREQVSSAVHFYNF